MSPHPCHGPPKHPKIQAETTIPNPSIMKRSISYLFLAAASLCGLASAQTTAYTTPVGYTTVTCTAGPTGSVNPLERNGSDTRVGLPFRQPTVAAAALTETPSSNVLTVTGASFGTDTYKNTHYVKFTSGPASGKVYAITGNTPTTITIDLSGDTMTAISGNTFMVTKFWTLGELFPPASCTSSAATTGTAVVSSTSAVLRNTDILLPNTTGTGAGVGINLSSIATYFVFNGAWRKLSTDLAVSWDVQQLWPDESFLIRHSPRVAASTVYVCTGEVDTGSVVIPLITRNGGVNEKQDIPVGLTRPIDVTLDGLHLGGTSAFVTSANMVGSNAKDALLVYNNSTIGQNKSSSGTYYYVVDKWLKFGGDGTNQGATVIPAGSAILIRKFGTAGGITSFWSNTPTY